MLGMKRGVLVKESFRYTRSGQGESYLLETSILNRIAVERQKASPVCGYLVQEAQYSGPLRS